MPKFMLEKMFEIAGSHCLDLPYDSKCKNPHGHNWIVTVYCAATPKEVEANNGMVVDFTEIKKAVHDRLDHQHLNHILPFNPTAENIAKWICEQVPHCYRVDVQESQGNIASYIL